MSEQHTIKSLRALTGKTQEQIAKRARMSVNTYAKAEAGKDVSLDVLGRIAKALRADLSTALEAWRQSRKVAR